MKLNSPSLRWFRATAFAMALAATHAVFGQGVTTSGVSGFVTDKDGKPVSGASVTVTLVASGTRYTGTTRSTGQYTLSGLLAGGPYTVTTSSGGITGEKSDVYLELG